MIRELLTPDAQDDPYVWSAVLIAHAGVGCAGWVFIGWWAIIAYVAFEIAQAVAARRALWWDSVLDICGFTLGAVLMLGGWSHNIALAAAAVAAIAIISAAGAMARLHLSGKDFHGQG